MNVKKGSANKGPFEKGPWQQRKQQQVYDNAWINVRHEEVSTPAGDEGIYGVVHFKNLAVGIIPVDAQGNTWLVKQYRYPLEQYSLEIPEGGCPDNETPLLCAQRELQEETGLSADNWTELLQLDLSNSVTDERAIVYLAEDLSIGEAAPEGTEDIQIEQCSLRQALNKVLSGDIRDAISVAALFKLHCLKPDWF